MTDPPETEQVALEARLKELDDDRLVAMAEGLERLKTRGQERKRRFGPAVVAKVEQDIAQVSAHFQSTLHRFDQMIAPDIFGADEESVPYGLARSKAVHDRPGGMMVGGRDVSRPGYQVHAPATGPRRDWAPRHQIFPGRTIPADVLTDALAQLEYRVRQENPAAFIAVNDEGLDVCKVIADDLNLSVPVDVVDGSARESLTWRSRVTDHRPAVGTAMVVGHFAWSGETLARAAKMTIERLHPKRICILVLACSQDALSRMESLTRALPPSEPLAGFEVPCLAADPDVTFGAHRVSITIEQDGYVFDMPDKSRSKILRTDLEKSRALLATQEHRSSEWQSG
ncbi:hypothetical protein ATO13_09646 [Stappia sp. 22II-S9-Z10]|nr:hypothetical protein ATO13_09646 [Stappia sp. 22II-S9-Z10]